MSLTGDFVPYLASVSEDFSAGSFYDVSDSSDFEQGLALPGWPGQPILMK